MTAIKDTQQLSGRITNTKVSEGKLRQSYFTSRQLTVFVILIITGLLMRWLGLGDRPVHHDESLHMMYGLYFYNFPSQSFYKYDAMLHGPLLYNAMYLFYSAFGVSTFSARVPAALFGSLLLFLPFLFKRYFTSTAVIILTGVIALSPTLAYWSRFIRHDTYVLLGVFLSLYGILEAKGPFKAVLFFLGVSIQFCAKENAYVHLAIVLGYIIFHDLFKLISGHPKEALVSTMFRYVFRHWVSTIIGVLLCAGFYIIFYSAYFMYMDGILDGAYKKSIMYWWEQSSMERIKGPFMFHWFILSFYESVFVLVALFQLGHITVNGTRWFKFVVGVSFLISLVVYVVYYNVDFNQQNFNSFEEYLKAKTKLGKISFLKLKSPFDVFGAFLLPILSVAITLLHLTRREGKLALAGYSFYALFYTYAVLGEKVPWLTLYPFIAGLVYLALYIDTYYLKFPVTNWQKFKVSKIVLWFGVAILATGFLMYLDEFTELRVKHESFIGAVIDLTYSGFWVSILGISLIALSLLESLGNILGNKRVAPLGYVNLLNVIVVAIFLYNFRQSYMTNFTYAGDAREMISQVHTTKEADRIANQVREDITGTGFDRKVFATGESVWPLTWYFHSLDGKYNFLAKTESEKSKYYYRFEDESVKVKNKDYKKYRLKLRGWWVPDYSRMNLRRFLHYAINREPWNPTGYSYVNFYRREGR